MEPKQLTAADYRTDVWNDWCPGCGNFGIVAAMYQALAEMKADPAETVVISGIGCSGKTAHFVNTTGVHTLHGRSLPFAQGIKLSNPALNVLINAGDGDLLGIGLGHFVALGRRNVDLVVMMHDNTVYALTKGQAAPTLHRGEKPKALNEPNIQDSVNPIALAVTSGYTFVARSYSSRINHLKETIKQAVRHKGSAFIDILQPCVTFDDIHTYDYYNKRVYELKADDWNPIVKDENEIQQKMMQAIAKSFEVDDRIPLGVFYENPLTPTFEERLSEKLPSYLGTPPSREKIEKNGKTIVDGDKFVEIFSQFIVEY